MRAPSRSSKASPAAARPRRKRVYGCETPRIFTPPLRPLTPQTSLGYAAIEFADVVCGVTLFPWQKWLLIHMLELAPGLTVDTLGDRDPLDPIFRFRKVVILVARQNGKSTLSQILALFFMYIMGTPLTLGTAQDLDTAEEVWEGVLDIIEETPELAELAAKPIMVNGKKTIRLKSGQRYKVKAANRRAGRGLSGDLIMLDELREHQTWDAWAAITKTTQARPAALIVALSNAGDATSVVLKHLRMSAHAVLGDPDGINKAANPMALLPSDEELMLDTAGGPSLADAEAIAADAEADAEGDTLGIFEWSALPGVDPMDVNGWQQSNPSLGYAITEAVLRGDAPKPDGSGDPEWVFRTECLCQWSDGSLEGIFPGNTWADSSDPVSAIDPSERVVACVTVSWDRRRSHIAVAGRRTDGRIHTGIVASRDGTDWIVGWLSSQDRPMDGVVVQTRGAPESSLITDLENAGIRVHAWDGSELGKAHGSFFDMTTAADHPLLHRPQPVLEVAAAVAVAKPMGDAWVIDLKKSAGDASPLKATVGATWGILNTAPPKRSAYETSDLVVA